MMPNKTMDGKTHDCVDLHRHGNQAEGIEMVAYERKLSKDKITATKLYFRSQHNLKKDFSTEHSSLSHFHETRYLIHRHLTLAVYVSIRGPTLAQENRRGVKDSTVARLTTCTRGYKNAR